MIEPGALTPARIELILKEHSSNVKRKVGRFYVDCALGELWAGDGYCFVPLGRLAPMFEKYDQLPEIGTYEIATKSLSFVSEQTPVDLASLLEDLVLPSHVATPFLHGGWPAMIHRLDADDELLVFPGDWAVNLHQLELAVGAEWQELWSEKLITFRYGATPVARRLWFAVRDDEESLLGMFGAVRIGQV